jgi:hypothetical protein
MQLSLKILHTIMWFFCIKPEHLCTSFKNNVSSKYLKYVQIIVDINHNMEFMWFLYKPIKLGFPTKFIQTYETY